MLRESHGTYRNDNLPRPKLCAVSLLMEAVVYDLLHKLWQRSRRKQGERHVFCVVLQEEVVHN